MDGIPLRSDHPCELAPAAVKHIRTHSVVYIHYIHKEYSIKLDADAGFFYFILLIGCNIWYRSPPSKDENYQKQKSCIQQPWEGLAKTKKRQRSTERWSDCDVTVVAGCWVVSPAIGDEIDGSYLWFSLSLSLSLRLLLLLLSFFFVFS